MFSFSYDAPQQPEDCVVDDFLIWAASTTTAAAAANVYTHYSAPPPPVILQPYKTGDETLKSIALGSGRTGGGDEDRKLSRKEIERRRRQQMSDLHSSLISLLPQPSRKGKKSSLSDQMDEVANYINHLKSNVQELSNRRDNLIKGMTRALPSSNNYSSSATSSNSDVDNATSSVTVRQRFDGVEVVISRGGFVLSKVMEAVIEEGFDIMSCISTQIGGRFYNTMQCQESTWVTQHIDLSGLQRKLYDVILY